MTDFGLDDFNFDFLPEETAKKSVSYATPGAKGKTTQANKAAARSTAKPKLP